MKSDGAFFGPRKDELDSERTYLRKSIKKELSASDYQRKSASKPSLPSKDDRPVMGIHTSKNFITANAVEAILQGMLWHLLDTVDLRVNSLVFYICSTPCGRSY